MMAEYMQVHLSSSSSMHLGHLATSVSQALRKAQRCMHVWPLCDHVACCETGLWVYASLPVPAAYSLRVSSLPIPAAYSLGVSSLPMPAAYSSEFLACPYLLPIYLGFLACPYLLPVYLGFLACWCLLPIYPTNPAILYVRYSANHALIDHLCSTAWTCKGAHDHTSNSLSKQKGTIKSSLHACTQQYCD